MMVTGTLPVFYVSAPSSKNLRYLHVVPERFRLEMLPTSSYIKKTQQQTTFLERTENFMRRAFLYG